jgi:V/A-type H+/Na+-transporting ATPase subunit I
MSTPQKMSKIRIVTPKSMSSTVIDTLYNLSLFHVKKYRQGELQNLDLGMPLATAEDVSQALLSVRSIKNQLGIENKNNSERKNDTNIKKAMERIQSLHQHTTELKNEQKIKENSILRTQQMLSVLKALYDCDVELELLPKLRYVHAFIGMITEETQFKEKVKRLKSVELKTAAFNGGYIAVLFVQKKDRDTANKIITEAGFTPLDFMTYKDISYKQLESYHKKLTNDVKKNKLKLNEIKKNSESFLCESEYALEEEVKKVELPLQFATTKQSLIATGFVPAKKLAYLKKKLVGATDNNVLIEEQKLDHDEKIPIKLNNTKTVKNFEVLTKLYELPSYVEVDPSSLMFLTFPLFFGIMLGDVGYGLITLFLFLLLKKKFPQAKSWFNILIFASIVTIIFGGVFGEYLGFEYVSMETGEAWCERGVCLHKEIIEHHGISEVVYAFPRLMNRVHNTITVGGFQLLSILTIGIGIGFLHLNFGLLIGFYNIWKAHGLKLAILEKLSWFIMEAGLAITLLSYLNVINISLLPGLAMAFAAVVMLYLGEGAKGIVEIPALFSNMLSYMRLGAVGLASVGLAVVVNENLALPLLAKGGIINIIIGTLVMVLGHTVNIALGIIGPFLHGIRLHYVEFFSKFFHGGGKEYTPFGKKAQMGGE